MNSESLAERIQAECQSGASVSDIIEIFQAAQAETAKDMKVMAEAVLACYEYVDDEKTPPYIDRELAAACTIARKLIKKGEGNE